MSPKVKNIDSLKTGEAVSSVVPQGILRRLKVSDIKPSASNPRMLFDPSPLNELKENIRQHGVLVPITVYEIKSQNKYAILDGERRYHCCKELEDEGHPLTIPANIVAPPDKIAGILYMFSIHNFREPWELMPTALSLKIIMEALGEHDNSKLSRITGLSEPQIDRCKTLLSFPEEFQDLSLDPNPKESIPSNFWIEASPVLDLCEKVLPEYANGKGRNRITSNLVNKYKAKRIKSVIHFRRIIEAYETHIDEEPHMKKFINRLREYIEDVNLETRQAFDEFVLDNRRIQGAIKASEEYISQLKRAKLDYTLEKDELIDALNNVKKYIDNLLTKLEGGDQPIQQDNSSEETI